MDTGDARLASKFAYTTFWLIVSSLAFFGALFLSQKAGLGFWSAFGVAVFTTVASIVGFTLTLKRFGIDLTSNV